MQWSINETEKPSFASPRHSLLRDARLSLLFSVSMIVSECMMQKKSRVVSGWHFKMNPKSYESSHSKPAENSAKEEGQEVTSREAAERVASISLDESRCSS